MGSRRRPDRRSIKVPPAWRIAAGALAGFFVAMGTAKLSSYRPAPGWFGEVPWVLIGWTEVIGGLMLLSRRLVSQAAAILAVVAAGAAVGFLLDSESRWGLIPALAILAGLILVGYARRPGALLRARLLRAVERYAEAEQDRWRGTGVGATDR
ncbi:hypothetical protein [Aquisphaera insulae]|uniref:hypothetical protein n=1 Tax=Aquisphaera insulae TaxID=2712864 RepID=UPI0013ED3E68|nr:hypothetical protein [Aquisphaera insulae]